MVLACIFLFGLFAIVSQATVIRELMVVVGGNEICVAVVLGTWLASVALGGMLGSAYVDKPRRMRLLLVFASIGLALGLPLAIYLVRIGRTILSVPPGELFPPLKLALLSLIGTAPVAFFVGYGFPSVCRTYAGETKRTATAIGTVYSIEGLGSVIGGALYTFLLVGRIDPFSIAAVCGSGLLLVVGLLMIAAPGRRYVAAASACFLICVVWGVSAVTGWTAVIDKAAVAKRWKAGNPSLEFVESRDSIYQNISVGVLDGQYNFYGNGNFMFAFPDEYGSAQKAHLVMAQHPEPKQVLVVGGGLEGLVGEILLHPVEKVDFVHLDPELTEMIETYMTEMAYGDWLLDERLVVHHTGGRAFVGSTKDKYDIVFLNVPDPTSAMLNRYYTREFYEEVKEILAPGGVVAAGVSASSSAMIAEEVKGLAGSVYMTLKDVYEWCVIAPGETVFFFASDSEDSVTSDTDILSFRYADSGASSDHFVPEVYSQIFLEDWVQQARRDLGDGGFINTDMNPVTYFYGLVLWARYTGSSVSGMLMTAKQSNRPITVLAAVLCLFALVTGLLVNRGSRGFAVRSAALIAIGSTGLAAMSAALVVMTGYQSFGGYVYQKVGILVGTFMGGIAVGGFISTMWLSRRAPAKRVVDSVKLLGWVDVAVVCLMGVLPLVMKASTVWQGDPVLIASLFYVVAAAAGVITGIEFPLGAQVFQSEGEKNVGRSSGLLEWSDHLGGMTGALLGGVILLPLLGVTGVCVFVGVLKVISVAGVAGACYRGVE